MKKSQSPYLLLIACIIITGLLGVIAFTSLNYDAVAAAPGTGGAQALAVPPGGGNPRPTRFPTAQLRFAGADAIVSPGTLSPGIPMTYTMTLLNEVGTAGNMTARNATLEIPWNGNQTFFSFSTDNPGWKLKTTNDTGVIVDLGDVKVNDTGHITIKATFATNYDKTIFRQTLYLNWNDDYAARRTGTNVTLPVDFSVAPPVPVPANPTPAPVPSPTPAAVPNSGAFAPVAAQASTGTVWYFPSTRHTLGGEFLNYWQAHCSVTNLGYPISEEYQDNGRTIQYFERVVMEFWPENPDPYKVLLRSLGVELNGVDEPLSAGTPSASDGSVFYKETGHWLDGRFLATWQDMGGLAQFGFPITEPIVVGDRLIQWTERARFELDLSRPNQLVMQGLVGNESARSKGY